MAKFRSEVDELFLSEMKSEDFNDIMQENDIDDLMASGGKGLFDDDDEYGDDLDDIIAGNYNF